MGVMGTIEAGLDITASALRVVEKIADKFPNYNQKKIEELRDLKIRYDREMKADIPNRDDNRVCHLRDQARIFIDSFALDIENIKEIKVK
jgi:hypothetical protein